MGLNLKDILGRNGTIRSGKKTPTPTATPAPESRTSSPAPPEPRESEIEAIRRRLVASLEQMKTLLKAIKAPLPTETGDGTSLPPKEETGFGMLRSIIRDLSTLGINSMEKVAEMGLLLKTGQDVNDRKYLMESLVQAAAKLPNHEVGKKITDDFVTTLWNDLSHPPQDFMDDQHKYRQADGSHNSYLYPNLGAAHVAYARTVKPTTIQPANLPDPGALFDTLMAREKPEEHPNRISSVLFYLASIIIHDVFRTNHKDFSLSDTSSYLDLAPLYGSDWGEQRRMRTFRDGKIKPDCFSETRLLAFPPGVGTLLIMFNRFHNYVAEQLAAINEHGRFTKPTSELPTDILPKYDVKGVPEKPDETWTKSEKDMHLWTRYDNDLFQTARLVTCGLYINIILVDYVRTILNLNRTDDNWQLNPRVEIENGPPLGIGNQVSAEFNLVYRWHSAISDRDDKWTQELFQEIFGKSHEQVTQPELLKTLGHMQADSEKLEPNERPFDKLKRKADGTFADEDLVKIMTESIRDCANAFGPRQVPTVMKAVEILGIRQARAWNLGTLNELRKHFALTPYRKFSEVTKDAKVAEMLKHFYDTPDKIEIYPGLVVEDRKDPKLPGSGLCPSFTTSRAVLSDAVALVRGDRFYTTSYHAKSLTNWGFAEQMFDLTVDNGCSFYKLFLRAFPGSFEPNSVYAHYPLTVPDEMEIVLKDLHKAHKYNFDLPKTVAKPEMIVSYAAAKQVMEDQESFKVTWGKAMEFLMGAPAKDFALAGDTPANAKSREELEKAMYMGPYSRVMPKMDGSQPWLTEVRKFHEQITIDLLRQKSYKLGTVNQVDIIRDVGNLAHVHFSAEMFSIPLKTAENPHGLFTEHELYLIMAAVFICIFFDVDPEHSFMLRQQAREAAQALGETFELEVASIKATGKLSAALEKIMHKSNSPMKEYGLHMLQRLIHSDPQHTDTTTVVWGKIMPTAGSMVANQGQLLAQCLDYLFTSCRDLLPELHALAHQNTPEADDKLLHYTLELSRLSGETGLFRSVARPTTLHDYSRTLTLAPGATLLVNLKAASRDPSAFPNPDTIDLSRPLESYIHLGHGPHQCLGAPMTMVALTTMLKVIVGLEGLRPAPVWPGPESRVAKVLRRVDGVDIPESWGYHAFLTADGDGYFPFPTGLLLQWDGEV